MTYPKRRTFIIKIERKKKKKKHLLISKVLKFSGGACDVHSVAAFENLLPSW